MRGFLIVVFALGGVVVGQDLVQGRTLRVGTGSLSGVYFPVGEAAAGIIGDADPTLQITVVATDGSVHNVEAIREGEFARSDSLDLALAQSDVVYQAYQGQEVFEGRAIAGLRSLMGLHPEPVHLLCNAAAGVTSFREIAGKRVSIGHPGSGNLHTVRVMLEAFGMSEADFSPALLDPARAYDSLRAGQLDCLFSTVGIGSTAIRELAGSGDVVLVELAEPELDALIRAKPYYAYATLPAGSYPGQTEELSLFGVKALLVASTELTEPTAYTIVQAILANLDRFLSSHPALAGLSREDLLEGLGAPLHPGAARAYREAGLLE